MTGLAERLRQRLEASAATDRQLLDADAAELMADGRVWSDAAVLVPITDRAEPGLVLTQRTDTLRRHAGQVAFPGGRMDAGETPVDAALREADEEIGLAPGAVEIVGATDRYRTGTGYEITPVLGVIAPTLTFTPNPAEVADVFEVPLAFILDAANHAPASAEFRGVRRHFIEITYRDRRIWGATAAMIVNLSRRLRWP